MTDPINIALGVLALLFAAAVLASLLNYRRD